MLLKLVLEDAILREESSYRFYESALEIVPGEREQHLLKSLCAGELRHRLKLEELQRRGEIEEIDVSGAADEGPREEEPAWPQVQAGASRREILQVALSKERQSAHYYRLVAGRSALGGVKDLFFYLAGEETEHVRWVETMLSDS
jgi:rubrerythrin